MSLWTWTNVVKRRKLTSSGSLDGTHLKNKYINFIVFLLILYLLERGREIRGREKKVRLQKAYNDGETIKGELKREFSLLHMKILTLIKAKSNVSHWYVQCGTGTQKSKTQILTTRVPPSWIEFDVVTSHRQRGHLEYDLWLFISMFLHLLISCKSQKNRLRVSSNRFK